MCIPRGRYWTVWPRRSGSAQPNAASLPAAGQELLAKPLEEEAQVTPALQRVVDALNPHPAFVIRAALGCADCESRRKFAVSL